MVIQSPPSRPEAHDEIEAGVIEDARARQRRHRRAGCALLAAAIVTGTLIVGFGGGSAGTGGTSTSSLGFGGGSVRTGLSQAFPGAPATQRNGYGVLDRACPLAPPNRYLPARAGCVEVKRVDLTGDGQPDLVIVYSLLTHRHPYWFAGQVPPDIAKDFVPEHPYLKVVLPDGTTVSTQIRGPRGTWAASIDLIEQLTSPSRRELILGVTQGSSGGQEVAYGMQNGSLVAAGAVLHYGGDSAYRAGFTCLRGSAPGVVQRTFELIGPGIYGWWRETDTTYSWRGPKLVEIRTVSFKEHGQPAQSVIKLGGGCGPISSANQGNSRGRDRSADGRGGKRGGT